MKRELNAGQKASLIKAQEATRQRWRNMTKAQRRKAAQAFIEAGTAALRQYWRRKLAEEDAAAAGATSKAKSGKKERKENGMSTVT
jgi:hypothetical protein